VNKDPSWEIKNRSLYISMHLDRLNEELISGTYGKQYREEILEKEKLLSDTPKSLS
jgi:hypothetical protein